MGLRLYHSSGRYHLITAGMTTNKDKSKQKNTSAFSVFLQGIVRYLGISDGGGGGRWRRRGKAQESGFLNCHLEFLTQQVLA